MLSLFNNVLEFNMLNLSYSSIAFLGVGISLFSFSSYYFLSSINDSNSNMVDKSVETDVEMLDKSVEMTDKGVQTILSKFKFLYKNEDFIWINERDSKTTGYYNKGIQTDLKSMVDKGVDADHELLEKLIGDVINDNISTDNSTRLTQDFIVKYKDNPKYTDFFKESRILEWSQDIENNLSAPTSTSSTSSQIKFLQKLKDLLKSENDSSNINEISTSTSKTINNNIENLNIDIINNNSHLEQLRTLKILEIKNLYSKKIDINILTDEDLKYIINSFTIENLNKNNINDLILEIIELF